MAKLVLLLATFALFLLLANASIYRTTVELDEEAGDNQQQRCRQQFQTHQRLRACQRFIRRQTLGGSSQDEVEEDGVEEIEEATEPDQFSRGPAFRRCCRQLRNISPPCRCPALRQAVRIQQGWAGPWQVRQMHILASNIPAMCSLPPRFCPFGPL